MYLKSVENVITLGKLIGPLFLFCLPLLSILFLNDLARPVMGTIFLVYLVFTLHAQHERGKVISVGIHIYIYRYVYNYVCGRKKNI